MLLKFTLLSGIKSRIGEVLEFTWYCLVESSRGRGDKEGECRLGIVALGGDDTKHCRSNRSCCGLLFCGVFVNVEGNNWSVIVEEFCLNVSLDREIFSDPDLFLLVEII